MRQKSVILLFAILCTGMMTTQLFAQRVQMTPEQRTQRLKDSLSLNDDQVAKVLVIYQDMDEQRKKLFDSDSEDRDARMQAMRSLADKTDEKIEALLTDDQKTKYGDMKKQRMQRGQGNRKKTD